MILANHGIISSSGGLPPSTLLTNLYAVYKAENNANDSLGVYNGTAQGGLTYTAGNSGNAFTFNGSNAYVLLPDNSLKSILTSNFSISLWLYPTAASNAYRTMVSSYGFSGANNYGFELDVINNHKAYFAIYNGASTSILQLDNTFTINQWNHFVVTRKTGSESKFYKNGNLVAQNTDTLDPGTTTTMWASIGALKYGVSSLSQYQANNNKIDEVGIWNKELTQAEITELYTKYYPY